MGVCNKELKLLQHFLPNNRVSCLAVSNKQCAEELYDILAHFIHIDTKFF